MHLHEILRSQLAIAQAAFGPLNILETGTIRGETDNYATDDGWSTVCFAEWAAVHHDHTRPQRLSVTSIDLEIGAARRVLEARDLSRYVALIEDHSVHALGVLLASDHYVGVPDPSYPHYHLAYLDSDNDPTLILCEYLLVTQMMPSGGIVLVDDVDPSSATGARKGHAIMPWLEKIGQEYTIVGRQGQGYSTNVLITRLP